ncbi:tetratricopeptide repeat protein [Accumulibacter sp.]|uniref:tetratricopeptide repeat protein n=1 Tax=Accumulibacter sp. TaxID=2053492 RepID=UPI0025847564|nr:tetratricopeptide repeat protein [Accumulibacter sp.]
MMTRKTRRQVTAPVSAATVVKASEAASPGAQASQKHRTLLAVGSLLLLALVIGSVLYSMRGRFADSPADTTAMGIPEEGRQSSYVGAAVCRTCHEAEYRAWSGSNHDRAMQATSPDTVLGDFADARFRQHGVESRFYRRGDRFFVRTDGPDGKLADYEISYTFGVYPLQQYLIAFPGGRYQALSIAWDSRPKAQGGQRWFHLQPDRRVDHKDPLHWSGNYQNWALQCAECHSTGLRKGYDKTSNTYHTTYSEISVACEACHGQGSRHVEWANRVRPPYPAQGDIGLSRLGSNWNEAWKFPADGARVAMRGNPADPAGMNVCAPCHARRSTLSEERKPGAVLEDSHRLAMLTAPNYHADGQQREEVYVWASFLQSKMWQSGVTCMDCHDPHSLQTRAAGNALCNRCHNDTVYDVPGHHRHLSGSKGAQCINCHMPTQNYMVIHARQDHSLRVPRPDLSLSLGTPNACNQCHRDRKPEWAASAMDRWYGTSWRDRSSYGPILHAGATRGVLALPDLLDLARNTVAPGIIRATAATLAQSHATPATLQTARQLLTDPDPLVRIAALGLLAPAPPQIRIQTAAPLLSDPLRGVRIEAARILADIPADRLGAERQAAQAAAMQEYQVALDLEADWPSGRLNLGILRLRQGRSDEAVAAFEQAIVLDPLFGPAYVNLADALRQLGRDAEGEGVLRRGLAHMPRNADLHHALGLMFVRQGDQRAALRELSEAARLAPDNPRFLYVEAIALHSAGRRGEALALLHRANQRHPGNIEILAALTALQ